MARPARPSIQSSAACMALTHTGHGHLCIHLNPSSQGSFFFFFFFRGEVRTGPSLQDSRMLSSTSRDFCMRSVFCLWKFVSGASSKTCEERACETVRGGVAGRGTMQMEDVHVGEGTSRLRLHTMHLQSLSLCPSLSRLHPSFHRPIFLLIHFLGTDCNTDRSSPVVAMGSAHAIQGKVMDEGSHHGVCRVGKLTFMRPLPRAVPGG